MMKPPLLRYTIREILGLVVMGAALFWPAGRIDWWQAWATLAVIGWWIVLMVFFIIRYNPDLLAERLGPRKGAKGWDTAILIALGLLQLARYLVAGFDQRYGWSESLPVQAQLIALTLCILGYALVVWATASNAFFSQIVCIQTERNHKVVTSGPYRFVRHSAYSGAILYEFAVSILLASWWALLVSGLSVILLVVRTILEDHTLQAELAGYVDYARHVRYRLLPGIW